MTDQTDRAARNEVLFREVNERVAEINREANSEQMVDFICECADPECVETVALTLEEYEDVRSDPMRFALRPGHEGKGVESVISRKDRFVVVRKHPEESTIARGTDPRA